MKPTAELQEGPEVFERFKQAAKLMMTFPKSALPPDPFGQGKPKKKKPSPKA